MFLTLRTTALRNVVMRHDLRSAGEDVGTVSETFPHLVFDKFDSKIGKRTANILKYLFPVPKDDSRRLMTFANRDDFISFRYDAETTPQQLRAQRLNRKCWCAVLSLSLARVLICRHHLFDKKSNKASDVDLVEVGPRFEMQLYQIKLGTLDQPEADDEWVLRPYMNTAKKRRVLA